MNSSEKPAMHATEKILADHAGKSHVRTGEIVNCTVDIAEVNDLYLQVVRSFYEMGGTSVKYPERVAFVFDHYSPAPTIQSAHNQKEMRDFVQDQKIQHFFDIHRGVCHQVMPENGLVWPGMLLIATDSHTTTHGAFGAFATGVGATDLASILLTGEIWLRVPPVIRVIIEGNLLPCVSAKDVILHVIGTLKQDIAVYKAIEYQGSVVDRMSHSERMTLCNMAVEMGAKTAYIQPDHKVLEFLQGRAEPKWTVYRSDPEYVYQESFHFDVNTLPPQVAVPHSVDAVYPIDQMKGTPVDQVFIGTCTNGRLEDIAIASQILKGRRVSSRCRLIIAPASSEVMLAAVRKGYVEALIESGATFTTPGCGPCLGAHQGVLAPGEVGVTTSSRNFPGRMGSKDASIYITSPVTAAATALEGRIADPRDFFPTDFHLQADR